jgi:hypothetical protein
MTRLEAVWCVSGAKDAQDKVLWENRALRHAMKTDAQRHVFTSIKSYGVALW